MANINFLVEQSMSVSERPMYKHPGFEAVKGAAKLAPLGAGVGGLVGMFSPNSTAGTGLAVGGAGGALLGGLGGYAAANVNNMLLKTKLQYNNKLNQKYNTVKQKQDQTVTQVDNYKREL